MERAVFDWKRKSFLESREGSIAVLTGMVVMLLTIVTGGAVE